MTQNFWPAKVFNPKIFDPKNFLTQKNFWPEKFFDLKYFWPEKFFDPKNFWPEKFKDPKLYIWHKNIFKQIFSLQFFQFESALTELGTTQSQLVKYFFPSWCGDNDPFYLSTCSSRLTKQKYGISTHVWLFPHIHMCGKNQTCVGIPIICWYDPTCLVITTYIYVWE